MQCRGGKDHSCRAWHSASQAFLSPYGKSGLQRRGRSQRARERTEACIRAVYHDTSQRDCAETRGTPWVAKNPSASTIGFKTASSLLFLPPLRFFVNTTTGDICTRQFVQAWRPLLTAELQAIRINAPEPRALAGRRHAGSAAALERSVGAARTSREKARRTYL